MSRDELLNKGWRRHSLISLSSENLEILAPELPEKTVSMASTDGAIALVALYDCGVVCDSFDDEPWVQLLLAVPTNFEKRLSKGRDPRRLHFIISRDEEALAFEVNPCGICQIDRELLLTLEVEDGYLIDDDTKHDLKQWLAERYRQDTWPDAFNAAVKPSEKRLKRFWNRYNDFLSGLYIKLDTYEELAGAKYTAAIIVAIEEGKERALVAKMRENNKQLKDKSVDEVKNYLASEVLTVFGDSFDVENDRTNQHHGKAVLIAGEGQVTMHQLRMFGRLSPYSLSEFGIEAPQPVEMTPGKVS